MMNLVVIPFHDWRKILKEGFRTRDAHFIEEFSRRSNLGTIVIVNRPTTWVEIFFGKKRGLIDGEKVYSKGGKTLYRLNKNLYLIDYISNDIFGQYTRRFSWFMQKYAAKDYTDYVNGALEFLDLKGNTTLLAQNVFAAGMVKNIKAQKKVFDAWDNFLKFQVYKRYWNKIAEGYQHCSENSDFWISNSIDNISFFNQRYPETKIHLIKNGVDLHRFGGSKVSYKPKDLQAIQGKIAGFGGKITHLIDVELINRTMKNAKEISFVFVGQILDNSVFDALEKGENFHYLGDKHYDEYPNYVQNFDFCLVPYVVDEEKKSGANTIKVYEYLATGKKVIGTPSNGLEDLEEYLYLVTDAEQFVKELETTENGKRRLDVKEHSWQNKTDTLIGLIS